MWRPNKKMVDKLTCIIHRNKDPLYVNELMSTKLFVTLSAAVLEPACLFLTFHRTLIPSSHLQKCTDVHSGPTVQGVSQQRGMVVNTSRRVQNSVVVSLVLAPTDPVPARRVS